MKAHLVAVVGIFCSAARAGAYDFEADRFAAAFAKSVRDQGQSPGTLRMISCDPETSERNGVCYYFLSPSVQIGVVSARGSLAARVVGIFSNGDRYGAGTMREAVRALAHLVSPDMPSDVSIEMEDAVLTSLMNPGADFSERRWNVGKVAYSFGPNHQLGNRAAVSFKAVDLSLQ